MKLNDIFPRAILWGVVIGGLFLFLFPDTNMFIKAKMGGFIYAVIMTMEIAARSKKKKRKAKIVKPEDSWPCGSEIPFNQCHGNKDSSMFPGI